MNTLIEGAYWPSTLVTQTGYTRRHDDTDGKTGADQDLVVVFGPDGDAWVTHGYSDSLRFRTWAGGGQSLRTRNALMILAEAIRRDNAERPQRRGPPEAPGINQTPVAEQPYLISKTITTKTVHAYNPSYGDERICECGHPYYRHFDSYEKMAPIGCKYCGCGEFKEKV